MCGKRRQPEFKSNRYYRNKGAIAKVTVRISLICRCGHIVRKENAAHFQAAFSSIFKTEISCYPLDSILIP